MYPCFSLREREDCAERQLEQVREVHRHLLQQGRHHRGGQGRPVPPREVQDHTSEPPGKLQTANGNKCTTKI